MSAFGEFVFSQSRVRQSGTQAAKNTHPAEAGCGGFTRSRRRGAASDGQSRAVREHHPLVFLEHAGHTVAEELDPGADLRIKVLA